MSNPQRMNLNYLLNKAYYDTLHILPMDDTNTGFSKFNYALINRKFRELSEVKLSVPNQKQFCLKTVYPGLLIGIGNTRNAGKKYTGSEPEGTEIKLGFTLDYVTGLPVIPGSTVKGVLHSAFKCHNGSVAAHALKKSEVKTPDIPVLLKSIFDGAVVFFDAIPVKADKDNRLLGLDNITPHPDPLKNPVPLTMLKVMPNVIFLFRFGFERWNNTNGVTAEKLTEVFEKILTITGIGAKTNVGFGVMESLSNDEKNELNLHYLEQDIIEPNQSVATKHKGICQWNGCTEETPKRKDGGFHLYCQKHYMESLKSKKNKGGA